MKNNKKTSEPTIFGVLPRKFTMTALFILCYTVIHINFEYNYWLTGDRDIFGKYEVAGEEFNEIEIAKDVYFTKATWMFALVWMMCLGMSFRSAIAYSYMIYSIELMFLFPIGTYTFLNLLLGVGCVIEDLIVRYQARGKEELV
ncbi:MAG: hypothetical protein GY870_06395 [archaeon]|nr:hypothetical protein [archaeon]